MAASLRSREIVHNVRREIFKDRVLGRAAELAFFLIMALFPLLIFLLTLLTFFPGSRDLAIQYLARVVPDEAMGLINRWVTELFRSRSGAVLSFGLLFSVWSASTGMSALMDILNTAYEVKEARSFIKEKGTAIILTIALTLLAVAGITLVIYGKPLIEWFLKRMTVESSAMLSLITPIGGVALLYLSLALIYNFGPNVNRKANRAWPGSIFAVIGILLASYLFSLYLKFGPSYNATYGSLGAVVVLMLWLYLVGLVIMVGAELNCELMKSDDNVPTTSG